MFLHEGGCLSGRAAMSRYMLNSIELGLELELDSAGVDIFVDCLVNRYLLQAKLPRNWLLVNSFPSWPSLKAIRFLF